MPTHEAEVLERGTGAPGHGTFIRTGVTDSQGNEYVRVALGGSNDPPPPKTPETDDDGDGPMKFTLAMRVRMVEIGLSVLTAACALGFWFLMDRMDSRFDRVDDPLRTIQASVSAQTEALKSVNERLSEFDLRLDKPDGNQSQASARTGKVGGVSGGTGSGGKPTR